MSSRWMILAAVALSEAAPLQAQDSMTYRLQRAAVLQDTARSEFERLRRLIGLAPTSRPTRIVFVDTVRTTRQCPMPVAIPDTSALAPMPRDRRDSSRAVSMPTAHLACTNSLFQP